MYKHILKTVNCIKTIRDYIMSKKNKHKPRIKVTGNKQKNNQTIPLTKIKPSYTVSTSSMISEMTPISGPNTNNIPDAPIVYFTPEVFATMEHIVNKSPLEVGWMCLVQKITEESYIIDRVIIPEQEVSAAETDINHDALAKVYLELVEEGEDPSRMYAWFHSHVNMGVSPSPQDENQISEFLETCPIFIRGIMNKAGDMKIDVYFREHSIAYTCVKTDVLYPPLSNDEQNNLNILLLNKVKKKPLNSYYYYPPVRNTPHNRQVILHEEENNISSIKDIDDLNDLDDLDRHIICSDCLGEGRLYGKICEYCEGVGSIIEDGYSHIYGA